MPGKTVAPASFQIVQDRARHRIRTQNHRNSTRDQRRDQIAESVGMRERDDREIAICVSDSHRFADVVAIGEQLFAAKTNQRGAQPSFRR